MIGFQSRGFFSDKVMNPVKNPKKKRNVEIALFMFYDL